MSWFWRTKPRSITKTVQWFPYFGSLEGQNWNATGNAISNFNQKKVYPTRRSYIYYAHSEDDSWLSSISYLDYLSGSKDKKETESNGRNDKSTFEFMGFGYVNKEGSICVTEMGRRIINGLFDQEDYLKQLLKFHLPNPIQKIKSNVAHPSIFPMQLVLKAFSEFESLNRSEIALLFGCDHPEQIPTMLAAIREFKEQYSNLPNKLDTKAVRTLFSNIYTKYYGEMDNKAESFYDYAEAFSRSLIYTGLFSISGRSYATKLRIAPHAKKKVELLQRTFYNFQFQDFSDIDSYMQWYGGSNSLLLPWEHAEERKELIQNKLSLVHELMTQQEKDVYTQSSFLTQSDLNQLFSVASDAKSLDNLKDIEKHLDEVIIHHNEDYFIRVTSKTAVERASILDKFDAILHNDDMSALWLEVNTWKSLIALQGTHTVKRNFHIEEDLSPRSFAPGMGNTPDMELYFENTILLPEVSLMTGVRQWEHEASSVIDHVMHFIKKEPQKQVYGLFISSRIHLRTMWQFFLLNRESWLGQPIPVIPITIEQYISLMIHCYEKEIPIKTLLNFFISLSTCTEKLTTYNEWEDYINQQIKEFCADTL